MIMSEARYRDSILLLSLLFLLWAPAADLSAAQARRPVVGVVFFSSRNCPLCESVKDLLKGLKLTYPVRVKTFDIEQKTDYLLFERLESIHGGKFSVPLIMLGDTILIGENDIANRLETTVQRLAVSGGSPFPYLGPRRSPSHKTARVKPGSRVMKEAEPETTESQGKACPTCDKKGRPPSLGEEWNKVKGLIERYF